MFSSRTSNWVFGIGCPMDTDPLSGSAPALVDEQQPTDRFLDVLLNKRVEGAWVHATAEGFRKQVFAPITKALAHARCLVGAHLRAEQVEVSLLILTSAIVSSTHKGAKGLCDDGLRKQLHLPPPSRVGYQG